MEKIDKSSNPNPKKDVFGTFKSWLGKKPLALTAKKTDSPKESLKKKEALVKEDGNHNPEILDIDLIKDEVPVEFEGRKNFRMLLVFSVLALLLVGQVYLVLLNWEKREIQKRSEHLKQEMELVNNQIEVAKEEASGALSLRNKLNLIYPTFSRHVYWSNFFNFLERNTLAQVYYSGFSGDTSGKYILRSYVSDFRAISFQLKTMLADKYARSCAISNEEMANGNNNVGVIFNMDLSVNPSIFTE